jgi:hypothetical protein
MKINEIILEFVTPAEISQVERFADALWSRLGVDVVLSANTHFLDRVNDVRNGKEVSVAEMIRLFKKEYMKYGKDISQLDNTEAVMRDLATTINVPFVLRDSPRGKVMIPKTIMRKQNFTTSNHVYAIEDVNLPKDQWETLISTADKEEVGDDLVQLVQQAYNSTPEGSFVNSMKDVIPSDWEVIDWDGDQSINATVFFRKPRGNENWTGNKIQGLGHDGQRGSKDRAVKKMIEMLGQRGYWLEGSDAMRAVLKRYQVPAISNEQFLQRLFNDSQLRMVDKSTYQRRLSNRVITESVFGKPILRF